MTRPPALRRFAAIAGLAIWAAMSATCASRPAQSVVDADADLYGAVVPSEENRGDHVSSPLWDYVFRTTRS